MGLPIPLSYSRCLWFDRLQYLVGFTNQSSPATVEICIITRWGRKLLTRAACVLLLFLIACFLSGAFGAIHNQVSYTVSPEYFTKFKFDQFGIDPTTSERLGAAYVGWQASWWMGIAIGIFVIPFGLLIRDTSTYFLAMLQVFGLILLTTICFGLAALAISYLLISPATAGELTIRGNIIANPAAFLRAGTMHNSSYLGGLVGTILGLRNILRRFLRAETGSARIFG